MIRQYTMNDTLSVAQRSSRDIENWLQRLPQTKYVKNVEYDQFYQKRDVDLILATDKGCYQIEIKGDRLHRTGNFFLETESNREKGTLGCFLYTQADWLFYYFIEPRCLYLLPMPATREWFLANRQRFPERTTTTTVRDKFYTTAGRLVPISVVLQEVAGSSQRKLSLT